MLPADEMRPTAYDRVATMFSPKGRLYQVEYASKIVEQGTIGVGIIYDKGVLLGAEVNVTSKLMVPKSIEKLFKIDEHVGAISAGLVGDARRIVSIAREQAQHNRVLYGEHIPISVLVKEICAVKQLFTQYAGMRPFGVSLIIGGVDSDGARRLFETEPSGALAEYKAIAIGRGKNKAMELLEKKVNDRLTRTKAIRLVVDAIKASKEKGEKLKVDQIDMAYIEHDSGFVRMSDQELRNVVEK
jgi:proteasome alpha subunit